MEELCKLDLACGNGKHDKDYIGVDIEKTPDVDVVHDLNVYPWPFEDNSVDEIYCSHYVEHIPHVDIYSALRDSNSFEEFKEKMLLDTRDGFIKFIEECYRILKPEGVAKIIAPYVTSVRAFWDPTHKRYIHDNSFAYFNKEWREYNKLTQYNINSDFDIKINYYLSNYLTLKSKEVRDEAFQKDWNAIDDIIVELIKRK